MQNVGIVGLGLIGGSLAKTIKLHTPYTVYGTDKNADTMRRAFLMEAIDGELTAETLPQCDVVLICLYPQGIIDYVTTHAADFKPDSLVIDCGGVKQVICDALFPVSQRYAWHFIGGHPMAGVERWGFDSSFGMLFNNASMILTPDGGTDIALLHEIKNMFLSIGFGSITVVSPEQHDRIIAYTSQLAHVVASAYIKSPTALEHTGMSAGSYKDMTRVASLNSKMWSELFLENSDNLLNEIDNIINNLKEYRDAIAANDRAELENLLEDGTKRKAVCG